MKNKRRISFLLLGSLFALFGCGKGVEESVSSSSENAVSSSSAISSSSNASISSSGSDHSSFSSSSSQNEEEEVLESGTPGQASYSLQNMEKLPVFSSGVQHSYVRDTLFGSASKEALRLSSPRENTEWDFCCLTLPSDFQNRGGVLSCDVHFASVTSQSVVFMLLESGKEYDSTLSYTASLKEEENGWYRASVDFSSLSSYLTRPVQLTILGDFDLTKSDSALVIDNLTYTILTTPLTENAGVALLATSAPLTYSFANVGEGSLSFDLLHASNDAAFGFFLSGVPMLTSTDLLDDSFVFSSSGVLSKSTSLKGDDGFLFQEGKRYKVDFSETKKTLTISSYAYEGKETDAVLGTTLTLSGISSAYFGFLLTQGTVVLDNILFQNGTNSWLEDLNQSELPSKLASSSSDNTKNFAFSWGYQGKNAPRFDVTFVDEEGTLLQEEHVCLYGHPIWPKTPTKEGYLFKTWLGGDWTSISADTVFYPSFEKVS